MNARAAPLAAEDADFRAVVAPRHRPDAGRTRRGCARRAVRLAATPRHAPLRQASLTDTREHAPRGADARTRHRAASTARGAARPAAAGCRALPRLALQRRAGRRFAEPRLASRCFLRSSLAGTCCADACRADACRADAGVAMRGAAMGPEVAPGERRRNDARGAERTSNIPRPPAGTPRLGRSGRGIGVESTGPSNAGRSNAPHEGLQGPSGPARSEAGRARERGGRWRLVRGRPPLRAAAITREAWDCRSGPGRRSARRGGAGAAVGVIRKVLEDLVRCRFEPRPRR
jgi:hypothetical protein